MNRRLLYASRGIFLLATISPWVMGDRAFAGRENDIATASTNVQYVLAGGPIPLTDPYEDYWNTFIRPIFGEGAPYPSQDQQEVMALACEPRQKVGYEPAGDLSNSELEEIIATYQDTIAGFRVVFVGGTPVAAPFEFRVESLRTYGRTDLISAFGTLPAGWDDFEAHHGRWGLLYGTIAAQNDLTIVAEYFSVDIAPVPDQEVECFLPDGTCEVELFADCTAAGGYVAPVDPLGDGDGDGVDDGRVFAPGRRTMIVPCLVLTEEQLDAFRFYEQLQWASLGGPVFAELGWGRGGPTDGSIPAVPGGLGEANGVALGVGSGRGESGAGQGDADCCNALSTCLKRAREDYDDALHTAAVDALTCTTAAHIGFALATIRCLCSGAAMMGCELVAVILYHLALGYCVATLVNRAAAARAKFARARDRCKEDLGHCCTLLPTV